MYNPKLSDDKKKKEVVRLSWWILEQKLLYYYPEYGQAVDDSLYDSEEIAYKSYCEDLGLTPTASNNVGFPSDTPSGKMVISKFSNSGDMAKFVSENTHDLIEKNRELEAPKRVRKRTRSRPTLEVVKEEPSPRRRRRRSDTSENIEVNRVRVRKRGPTKN